MYDIEQLINKLCTTQNNQNNVIPETTILQLKCEFIVYNDGIIATVL